MSNFPVLEVVIGLSFVYFVFSLICSAVTEAIASRLEWRAQTLEEGITNLLSGSEEITSQGRKLAGNFFDHPLIQGLVAPKKPGAAKAPRPSYIPSRTFVAALMDIGARGAAKPKNPDAKPDEKSLVQIDLAEVIGGIENPQVREALFALYREADGRADAFRRGAEQWFDDSMARVSGWYRRKAQRVLWITAAALVLLLNIDTVQIASTLWTDDANRAAVVARAEKAAQEDGNNLDLGETASSLEVPIGWNLFEVGDEPQDIPNDATGVISKLFGLLITVAALSLGAPFWFDLLGKFVRVRGTGPPPRSSDHIRKDESVATAAGEGSPR
jgi:hypothetical protein